MSNLFGGGNSQPPKPTNSSPRPGNMVQSKPTVVDLKADELGARLESVDKTSLNHPEHDSDPFQTGAGHKFKLGQSGKIVFGRVHMCYPYLNSYTVAVGPQFGGMLICTNLQECSTNLMGARDTTTLAPDTTVLVWYPDNGKWGYILGSFPSMMDNGNYVFSDWTAQGGNTGLKRDKYYTDMLTKLVDQGGTKDFSNHQPLDSNSLDWGRMTELGGGIHIDPWMTYLRIDESTGLYGFYHDQLMRLSGHNLDIISGTHEELYRDDEGENTYYRGESPYPWEVLGSMSPGGGVHKENTPKDVHLNIPEGTYEPTEYDQQPFYRYQEYGGYLGQGRIRLIALPPTGLSGVNKFSTESAPVGVFREQISLDGSYALASAKSIIISKRALIAVPKQIKLPEDYSSEADGAENGNYKAAGYYGEGDDHKVKDPKSTGEFPHLVSVAGMLDLHSYTFNWKNIHPFHYHKKDYILPEEADITPKISRVTTRPDFSRLTTEMWLPRPTAKTLKVDHRHGEVDYYENMSHMTLTDDGSVVIQGGNGEELRMVGGNIQLSCPGDVLLQPGRSVVSLAGKDAVIRAKGSVDITSTDKNVRIKAERNLHMLAANNGSGGILLESRSVSDSQYFPSEGGDAVISSGIVLKSKYSQIVGLSKDIYLRTGVDNGPYGAITLDAGEGKGYIQNIGYGVNYHLNRSGAVQMFYGTDTVRAGNIFSGVGADIGTPLRVDGHMTVDGSAIFKDYVLSVSGLIYSGRTRSGYVIRPLEIEPYQEAVDELKTAHRSTRQRGERRWKESLVPKWYSDDKAGDTYTQKQISFSLRNSTEYSTENFKLPETNWQVLAGSSVGNVYKERVVLYQGSKEMMPWPGKKAWTGETLLQFSNDNLKLFDVSKGVSVDRSDEYADVTYEDFTTASPNEAYKIISG